MEKLNKQRGLRNCNPLNIRRTADLWQGLAERQPDPEFFTFRSMSWGYRAAFIVLRTYCHKYGLRTVRDIIAPDGHRPKTVTTRKATPVRYAR